MAHRIEELRLRLIGDDDIDTELVRREFPAIRVERALACAPGDIVIDDHTWRGAFNLGSLDERVQRAGSRIGISVRGWDVTNIAYEVVTRYQRYLGRRNEASSTSVFDAVLTAHEGLYAAPHPQTTADLEHALDTWQWVLRLRPDSSLATQLAALFHDVDRLESDPRERIEHRVPDGQSINQRSAERMLAQLVAAGVAVEDAERARDIVYSPERRSGDLDVQLLDDADSLSFLSLSSSVYSDYFGIAQTRRKVAYTVARLGPVAREKLDRVHLRPDVERLLREIAA